VTDDLLIPVTLLTGFLGSGKTTLLKSLLSVPEMRDTAVVINEFGEISIDHLIVRVLEGETIVLRNGCVCCSLRDDLGRALMNLLDQVAAGVVPKFRRVIVETTGLADPVPILQTLVTDPRLRHQFRQDRTIVTVDALFGDGQLREHAESVQQAAVADHLVITKTDLAEPFEIDRVQRALRRINPGARLTTAGAAGLDTKTA